MYIYTYIYTHIYIDIYRVKPYVWRKKEVRFGLTLTPLAYELARHSPGPLQDIGITNIVWCMAYTREVGGGGAYTAQ